MIKVVFKTALGMDNDQFPITCDMDVTENGDLIILNPKDDKPMAAYAKGTWETCKREQ